MPAKELSQKLGSFLNSKEPDIPIFDQASLDLIYESEKEEADFKKIQRIITHDASLTSKVLRRANSPVFRGIRQISTVDQAIIRLGLHQLVDLALIEGQRSKFVSKSPKTKKIVDSLWIESLACAHGAKWIAQDSAYDQVFCQKCFVAGLLAPVGKLFVVKAMDQLAQNGANFHYQDLVELIQQNHVRAAYNVAKYHNFPEDLTLVIQNIEAKNFDDTNILLTIVRLAHCILMGAHKTLYVTDRNLTVDDIPESQTICFTNESKDILLQYVEERQAVFEQAGRGLGQRGNQTSGSIDIP